jgi:hypothetical protein
LSGIQNSLLPYWLTKYPDHPLHASASLSDAAKAVRGYGERGDEMALRIFGQQAKAIGEIKAITDDTQGEALRSRLADLAERLGKSEQALSGFEEQMNDILASLSADRESREEQARLMSEMKTMMEGLSDQSARSDLAGLNERLANVETTTDKFEQYRKAFETALMANRQLQLAQSQTVNTQLKTITQGLRNTLGYDVKKNFKCDSCGADGAVALRIRCTHCEKENWWGWWPKDKS